MSTSQKHLLLLSWILIGLLSYTCSSEDPEEEPQGPLSTFDIIQSEIFDKNCVSCHQAGTSFARQSDLILTEGQAYAQLVDRAPKNVAAKADGLVLLGTEGLSSLYNSFLWEKINFPDYAHYQDDHPEYGELMPSGGQSLTNGELRFISEWIIAGAPDTGQVVDIALLADTERFQIPDEAFAKLPPPANGLQLSLGPFDIAPQSEREFHYYQPLDNTEEIYVNRIEVAMKAGSHHFIVYDFPNGNVPDAETYRDFYDEDGSFKIATAASLLNNRFVAGTQLRNSDYSFPDGVALKLAVNHGLDLNSHYVNRTDEVTQGEVSVNLHTVDKSQVRNVAENLFESWEDIFIPAGKETTIERSFEFERDVNLFQLTSHAHQHMTEFEIYIEGGERDGDLIFFTNDWEHPPLLTFDPAIPLKKGEGLRARTTYNNKTNKDLRFGLLSEDEMMIVFGAYY